MFPGWSFLAAFAVGATQLELPGLEPDRDRLRSARLETFEPGARTKLQMCR